MAPLNIHPEESATKQRKNNKILKILLGIGALIAVPAIGSTLAANINISSGTVQFGQGTATAAACDSTITVVPNATFVETDNAFKLGSVTISALDPVACASKTLRFRFYPTTNNSDSALTVASGSATTDAIIVTMPASGLTAPTKEASADYTVSALTTSVDPTSFTVTLTTQPATTSIDRITVESY